MRIFYTFFGVFFLFSGVLAAQEIGYDLLALPQANSQAERVKAAARPEPKTEAVPEFNGITPDVQERPIGALLLKTGSMIIGEATLEKNVYNVFGAKGKPKIPAYKVEFAGKDRHDVYLYKRDQSGTASYDSIFALAKWCVVNAMYDEAIAEFQNCKPYAAYPQIVKSLDKEIAAVEQIKINVQKRENAASAVVESIRDDSNENVTEDDFDYKSWGLVVAPTVLEKFKKDVQPQLIRRCGAADCHGSNSRQEFRLAPRQKYSTAETTLRNLKATFDHLDFQEPSASPLFAYPQRDHGGVKPIYTRQTRNQLTPLYNWAQLIPNTMPDVVDKYLAQKEMKNKPVRTLNENATITQAVQNTQIASPNTAPIEQVSHDQPIPATTGFSFFNQNQPIEQKVELVPSGNGFRSNPNRQPVQTPKAAPQASAVTPQTVTPDLPNVNPRQTKMPTQTIAKDPFDPTLFNQKYHE